VFHYIQQYALQRADGRWYRPRAYGDPQSDGRWEGWLVFFPLNGGEAIAPPHAETKQTTFTALSAWAAALTPVYMEGALERALTAAHRPAGLISERADVQDETLLDAERLQTSAEVEGGVADLDDERRD
jgi:hypothetical protein